MKKTILLLSTLLVTSLIADYQSLRLTVWTQGETIEGDEFIASTESVFDYLKSLDRPTEPLKPIRYRCLAKTRVSDPPVYSQEYRYSGFAQIRMVYDLKECKKE